MYKKLCVIAILLVAFGLVVRGKAAEVSASAPYPPATIVARGKLVNQTATIPTNTIFTPTVTGLYRLSVYATITTADSSSASSWFVIPEWTDDSGEIQSSGGILVGTGQTLGQFIFENSYNIGGFTSSFEAKAGTPIAYFVSQQGPPDNSAYSLYYTLERME